jgi:hypothetical protein
MANLIIENACGMGAQEIITEAVAEWQQTTAKKYPLSEDFRLIVTESPKNFEAKLKELGETATVKNTALILNGTLPSEMGIVCPDWANIVFSLGDQNLKAAVYDALVVASCGNSDGTMMAIG